MTIDGCIGWMNECVLRLLACTASRYTADANPLHGQAEVSQEDGHTAAVKAVDSASTTGLPALTISDFDLLACDVRGAVLSCLCAVGKSGYIVINNIICSLTAHDCRELILQSTVHCVYCNNFILFYEPIYFLILGKMH